MKKVLYICFVLLLISASSIQAQDWMILQVKVDKLLNSGNYTEAIKLCEETKKKSETKTEGKATMMYAWACNLLGKSHEARADYKESEKAYLDAVRYAAERIAKDSTVQGGIADYFAYSCNLILLYANMGNFAKAFELTNQIQRYYKYAYPLDAISYLSIKGIVLLGLSKYTEAISNLEESIKLMNSAMKTDLMYTLDKGVKRFADERYLMLVSNLAIAYNFQGDTKKSDSIFLKSINFYAKPKDALDSLQVMMLSFNLAQSYIIQKKFQEADSLLQVTLDRFKNLSGAALLVRVKIYYFLTLIYLNNHADLDKIEPYLHEAKDLLLKHAYDKKMLGMICRSLGSFYERNGQYQKSAEEYRQGIQALYDELESNIYVLSEKDKNYNLKDIKIHVNLVNAFGIRHQKIIPEITEDLYNQVLLTKGFLLYDTQNITQTIKNSQNDTLKKEFANWQDKKQYLSKLYPYASDEKIKKQILDLEQETSALEGQLSAQSAYLAKALDKKRSTWKDIQKELAENERAVEIVRVSSFSKETKDSVSYIALILTPDTEKYPEMVVLAAGQKLEGTHAWTYKRKVINKSVDRDAYKYYWSEIAAVLYSGLDKKNPQKKLKVYFSGDGIYHQINLATLYNDKTEKYLYEEIDLVLLNSTREILGKDEKTKQFTAQEKQVVVLGHPDYDLSPEEYIEESRKRKPTRGNANPTLYNKLEDIAKKKWEDLPQTLFESQEVHDLFKSHGWESRLYQDQQALEAVLKKDMDQVGVVHIATHGFVLNKPQSESNLFQNLTIWNESFLFKSDTRTDVDPMLLSGIVLAGVTTYSDSSNLSAFGSQIEDGLLTAYEASGLNLDRAELVTLSACQTGLGEIQSGEGVYGLQRAFQIAGAKSVLMSLWQVEDVSTRKFMAEFYRQWLSGKTKHEALQLARQKIREEYKYPYYWGAFVLVGE
ncbi:MAG: CHAT domain-containing protein [Microscillaceae bacterium]|nr:CHAT domain-containing protein [Microscillaceae bacterium]